MRLKNLFGLPGSAGRSPGLRLRHIAGMFSHPSRIYILLLLLGVWLPSFGGQVKFERTIPAENSGIASFDFTLVFDLSAAMECVTDIDDWGLAYDGSRLKSRKTKIYLYEGTPEGPHTELATTYTSNYDGTSPNFVTNNNTLEVTFSETLKPEPGKNYYLQIGNTFMLCRNMSSDPIGDTLVKYGESPIIVQFVGRAASSEELVFQNSSIESGSSLDEMASIGFTFNTDIQILDNAKVSVIEGGTAIDTASRIVLSDDKKSVVAYFEPAVTLLNNRTYAITLEANSVALASDNTVTNNTVPITVTGTKAQILPVIAVNPAENTVGLYETVSILWDVPEHLTFKPSLNYSMKTGIDIYMEKVSEETFFKNSLGLPTEDGNGIEWTLTSFNYEPDTRYILVKPANDITLFTHDDVRNYDYTNEEVVISFTTPSLEDSGVKPLEFGEPVLGKHGTSDATPFVDGMSLSWIGEFEIPLKDLRYTVEDGAYDLSAYDGYNRTYGYLYEVDGDNLKLVSQFTASLQKRESPRQYYNVASANIAGLLYEGKTYRIVIPAKTYCVGYKNLKNYLSNPEFSYTVKGAAPTSLKSIDCTLTDNQEVEDIYNVVWTISAPVQFAGETTTAQVTYHFSSTVTTEDFPIYISNENGHAKVKVDCTSTWGNPVSVKPGTTATVRIPAGTLCYISDPTIVNNELSVSVVGKEKVVTPPVKEPEFVNLSVSINGIHTTTLKAVKDYEATINIVSDDNWKVTSLERDGNNVLGFLESNGDYVTPALKADSKVEAAVEYKGLIVNDNPVSVVEIESDNIKIYSEGDHIIVDGLKQGDNIAIYATSGLTVCDRRIESSDVTSMSFKVRNGEVYLVRVNDKAAKIRH